MNHPQLIKRSCVWCIFVYWNLLQTNFSNIWDHWTCACTFTSLCPPKYYYTDQPLPHISWLLFNRKAWENVCVKRLCNQPITLRQHRPLVCFGDWVCVCVWGGCLNEIGWRGGLQREAEGKSHYGLLQSLEFLRSPPLHACYIVKPETAAGLYLVPHDLQDTGIVQHYAR